MLSTGRNFLKRVVAIDRAQTWRNFSKTIIPRDNDLTSFYPSAPAGTSNVSPSEYVASETGAAKNVQQSTLSNGFKVISTDSQTKGNSVVSLFVNAGSRYENYYNNGVSHYVERFFYSGTNQRSYLRLVTDLQKTGADVSAQAGREDIVYQFESLREAVPQILELVADSVLQGRLHDWDLPPKVDAVKLDLEIFSESPELMLNEALHQTAFGNVTLGRSLICPPYNVKNIDTDTVLEYMDAIFVPSRMTLVGTNIEHDSLVQMSEALFGSVQALPKSKEHDAVTDLSASSYQGGSSRLYESRHGDKCYNVLAFKGVANTNTKDYHVLNVLTGLLGQGTAKYIPRYQQRGSKLSKIVESGGLEHAKAFNIGYSDNGLFGVYSVGQGSKVSNGIQSVISLLKDISRGGLSEGELNTAKNIALLEFSTALESNIGQNEFNAKYNNREQHVKQIQSVTQQDLTRLASQLLKSQPTVVSYGNLDGLKTDIKL